MKKKIPQWALWLFAGLLLALALWWQWFYISEADVRQAMNFTLPPGIEFVETRLDASMAYFSVPPELVDELAETFENTFGYDDPPYRGKEKIEGLKSKLTGDVIRSYFYGQLSSRPSHFCILTQDGDAYYLWYIQE